MLNTKVTPVGIDLAIDNIQKTTYDFLTNSEGWTNYESYPRAYKNRRDKNIIPEIAIDQEEYIEVLYDDKFNVTSFFLVEDKSGADSNEVFTGELSMIFQGDIQKLYGGVPHRADEEMHDSILKSLSGISVDAKLVQIVTGVKNVYEDLNITGVLRDGVNLDDMSNFHVVRVVLEFKYYYRDCKIEIL